MPSREIDFSFENAQDVLQITPLRAISSALWSRGQKMVNQDKMAPLLRPLGIILKGASRGITTDSDTATWQSGIATVALGLGSAFFAVSQAPGFLVGIGIVAATAVSSAVIAPYALSVITATALSIAAIPKAIINLPQSFKDAARAREMAAQKLRQEAMKAKAAAAAAMAIEQNAIPTPAQAALPVTLLQSFERETLAVQTQFIDELATKFPDHFTVAAQKIADRDAGMKGVLTAPAKLMAKPIQLVKKDTTTP